MRKDEREGEAQLILQVGRLRMSEGGRTACLVPFYRHPVSKNRLRGYAEAAMEHAGYLTREYA